MSQQNSTLTPAAEAYIWGYPLLAIHRTRLLLCSRTPTGQMNHVNNLATPNDKAIVAPNNDTLYSSAWFDLSYGDLVIEVPPMDHPSRYWNVQLVDAYHQVTYISRRDYGVSGTTVRVTLDPSTPSTGGTNDTVTVATPTVWVIIRVLVESEKDIEAARALQRAITVTGPQNHPSITTERAGRATEIGKAGVNFFSELKRFMDIDPPAIWHMQPSPEALAIIEDPSKFTEQSLLKGIEDGDKLIAAGNAKNAVRNNGWSTGRGYDSPDNILSRASGVKFGLGGHYAIENRSYIAFANSDGGALNGNTPLDFTFSADDTPPCDGFWSLTAYGMDLYLVQNEIDRWSFSDRTPGLRYANDGSLTITLSAEKPRNPNWLPVPDGPYMLGLRVYEGQQSVLDCEWFPPVLKVIDA